MSIDARERLAYSYPIKKPDGGQQVKKPVSERAIVDRLRRALKKEGVTLHKSRPNSPWLDEHGEWYTVKGDHIEATHLDLERLAIDNGCLKSHEELEQE